MTPEQSQLGKPVTYVGQYNPSLLFPINRQPARLAIGLAADRALPFSGADIWNAYELSWLDTRGKPQIALARLIVPADSPNIIESKSLKLYLGSFSQTPIESPEVLRNLISHDVSRSCEASVAVKLILPADFKTLTYGELPGVLLDQLELDVTCYTPCADLLCAASGAAPIHETLVSNLLKSNCPVTGQPDWASVQICYEGYPIDRAALLRYILSYRQHTGFHEQCVEQIFLDIQQRCHPDHLSVYARYTRRGGLDINPFRTNFDQLLPEDIRTARQ